MSLKKLDEVIGLPIDGWHEYNVENAAKVLTDFDSELFEKLSDHLNRMPTYWRVRCAEALGEAGNTGSLKLLADLLRSNEKEVAVVAASALDDLDFVPDTDYVDCLSVLLDKMNPHTETRYADVKRLLGRISKS